MLMKICRQAKVNEGLTPDWSAGKEPGESERIDTQTKHTKTKLKITQEERTRQLCAHDRFEIFL
jgi:hypothetical protein